MLSTQSQINYDKKFDILYYHIGDTSNSYGDEIDDKIILLKDINTENLTGITVFDFLKTCSKDIDEMKNLQKHFDVSSVVKVLHNKTDV